MDDGDRYEFERSMFDPSYDAPRPPDPPFDKQGRQLFASIAKRHGQWFVEIKRYTYFKNRLPKIEHFTSGGGGLYGYDTRKDAMQGVQDFYKFVRSGKDWTKSKFKNIIPHIDHSKSKRRKNFHHNPKMRKNFYVNLGVRKIRSRYGVAGMIDGDIISTGGVFKTKKQAERAIYYTESALDEGSRGRYYTYEEGSRYGYSAVDKYKGVSPRYSNGRSNSQRSSRTD